MIIIIFFMLQTIIYSNVIIKKVSLNKVIFDLGRLPFHLRAG